jgi:hypothetical protein
MNRLSIFEQNKKSIHPFMQINHLSYKVVCYFKKNMVLIDHYCLIGLI